MGFLDQLKDAGADAASDMKKILTKDGACLTLYTSQGKKKDKKKQILS